MDRLTGTHRVFASGLRNPTGLGWHTLLPALAKTLVAAAGMGLAAWGWGNWVYHTVYLGNLVAWNDDWLTVLVGIPLALSVYLGVHKLLQSEELALALGLLRRRQR